MFHVYVSLSSKVCGIPYRSGFVLNFQSETIPPIFYSIGL